jgi:hypothetical protein
MSASFVSERRDLFRGEPSGQQRHTAIVVEMQRLRDQQRFQVKWNIARVGSGSGAGPLLAPLSRRQSRAGI